MCMCEKCVFAASQSLVFDTHCQVQAQEIRSIVNFAADVCSRSAVISDGHVRGGERSAI